MAYQPERQIELVRPVHCSFCGKSEDAVRHIVVASAATKTSSAICDECFGWVKEIFEIREAEG
ncbi:MAG TPA: ClpX C4-type zinc finger protein [Actinomycetota bacterium]|nr:ClpX C4-type zinc finger protein [Actinomycetota bacterium]